MLYTFTSGINLQEMATNMEQFVALIGTPHHERSSLVAFFQPDPSIMDHMSFVTQFWQVLQFLHEHDRNPATNRTPR
jgi:FPC/CPF motif-containing protein YcgG